MSCEWQELEPGDAANTEYSYITEKKEKMANVSKKLAVGCTV